jgi:hypothetical protein
VRSFDCAIRSHSDSETSPLLLRAVVQVPLEAPPFGVGCFDKTPRDFRSSFS